MIYPLHNVSYFRRSGAIGLATIRVISDNREDADAYAKEHNLESMYTYSARSLNKVVDLRKDNKPI